MANEPKNSHLKKKSELDKFRIYFEYVADQPAIAAKK